MNLKTATLIALISWIAAALFSIWEFFTTIGYGGKYFLLKGFVELVSVVSLVIFLFVLHSKQKGA